MKKLLLKLAFRIIYKLSIPSLSHAEFDNLDKLKAALYDRYKIKKPSLNSKGFF